MEANNRTGLTHRLLALAMAAVLLLSLIPGSAFTVWAEGPYTVNVAKTGEGVVKLNGIEAYSLNVNEEESVALEVRPAEYWVISSVTIQGEEKTVSDPQLWTGSVTVTEDVEIDVVFEELPQYTVTVQKTGSGEVLLDGVAQNSAAKYEGSTLNVKVTPAAKYAISSIEYNGAEQTVADPALFEDSVTITEALAIDVVFIKTVPEHSVTVTKTGKGTVRIDGTAVTAPVSVDEGDSITVEFTPDSGYEINSIKVDGVAETLTEAEKAGCTRTLTVNANMSIKVEFKAKTYKMTAAAVTNGSISLKLNDHNVSGSSLNFTVEDKLGFVVKPNNGYSVSEVKLNDKDPAEYGATVSTGSQGSLVFSIPAGVAENLTIQASFQSNNISWNEVSFTGGYFTPPYSEGNSLLIYVYPKSVSAVKFSVSHSSYWFYVNNGISLPGNQLTGSAQIESMSYTYQAPVWQETVNVRLPASRVLFVLDKTAPEIKVDKSYEGTDGNIPCFNSDIDIPVSAIDPDWVGEEGKEEEEFDNHTYSGVVSVTYELRSSDSETEFSGSALKSGTVATGSSSSFVKTASGSLHIPFSTDLNDKYVQVKLTATDRAGNSAVKTFVISFSDEVPTIESFSFTENEAHTTPYGGTPYYGEGRTAKIVIQVNKSFDGRGLSFVGTVKDIHGNEVETVFQSIDWVSGQNTEGKKIRTGTITLNDGRYDISAVRFVSRTGVESEYDLMGNDAGDRKFVVDREDPTAKLNPSCEPETYWSSLFSLLTFGRWSKEPVTIFLVVDDDVSEILRRSYYLSESETPLSRTDLEAVAEDQWVDFAGSFTVPANKKFAAYVRVTDAAGHTIYVGTDGIIVDDERPVISMTPSAGYNGERIYGIADNAKVDVTVTEPANGSGLKTVRWWLEYLDGGEWKKGDEGVVLEKEYDHLPTNDELIRTESFTINVDKEKHNWSHVKVYVDAVDNAGNVLGPSETPENLDLDIDVTAPVISIEYERTQVEGADPGCYNELFAYVKIQERTNHFDPTAAENGIVIEAKDADGNLITEQTHFINPWITEEGAKPDDAVHTTKIAFLRDGNYTIKVNYTDEAGNPATEVLDSFTLDSTPPEGTITVNGKGTWSSLAEVLTFGLWSSDELEITATGEDDVSSVVYADYYKTDAVNALTLPELKSLPASEWKSFNLSGSLKVPANERFTVYLRLRDQAGNARYLSTDGVIVDDQKAALTLKPSAPAKNGIYNADSTVKVGVEANDQAPYSGIQSVEYWVTCDGVETAREKLYEVIYTRDPGDEANGGELEIYEYGQQIYDEKGHYPTHDQLTASWSGEIEIDKSANNSCNVEVFVCVKDNAGNSETKSVKLDIDATLPEIYVYYDNNEPYKTVGERGYYPKDRTATIVIFERDHHFSAEDATAGIVITAKDAKGNAVLSDAEIRAMIGAWEYKPGEGPDGDRHIAEIHYSTDANYTFEISYTDLAGNVGYSSASDQKTPWAFTVDKTAPTASIEAKGINTWDKLAETLTFGIFTKVKVDYTGAWDDATSPIESVSYYKTDSNKALKVSELNAVTGWKSFNGLSVSPNERVTVYLRVVDYAGNTWYVSTDGIIIDDRDPVVQNVTPKVTVSPAQPVNGIYNTDVPIRVTVEDPIVNGSYAGLKEIRYEVKNMGAVTQSGTLYSYSGTAHSQSDLKQSWDNSSAIVVDRNKNNSNNVEIFVYAVDNAGNEGKGSTEIKIDVTPPSISVSYDNNNGDNALADATSGAYFNAPRTATIVVTERNFDPAAVQLTLSNAYGVTPALSAWRTEGGGGNGDGTRNIATLTFAEDGNYNVDVACSDQAGNRSDAVTWNGLSPQRFTVDRTAPVIRVVYDPDDSAAKNGSYFDGPRTATITINERNFETSRVEISLSATDHGSAIALPAVEGWTTTGDSHTATISYTADGLYSFDIAYRDKAGNAADDYAGDSFTVDQTPPAVEITGVTDESANGGKGKLGFTLTATDTNFDVFEPVVSAAFYRDGEFVNETLSVGEIKDVEDGKQLVVDNLPEDGIYTVRCTVVDKAGNAFEQITLYDKDGKAYTADKTAADVLTSFSINRKGSAYGIDENTAQLVEHYYVQRVNDDVVLVEINTDEVKEHSVTLNGKELTEGVDYTVTEEGGKGEWHKYVYHVNAALFEAEGAYSVVVSSTDMADNATFSDVKGVGVKFVVDRTAPVVTVAGMETDGRYQTERQLVTLIPTDDGGALRSLLVVLVDEDGKTVRELVKLEGEEFDKALEENDGKITFTLEEGLYQNVRVVCDDWAWYGEEENVIYDETFTDVSVSSSAIKIFWANKSLRWGSIGGVGGLGAAGILFALLKKRKKKEADVKEVKKDAKK